MHAPKMKAGQGSSHQASRWTERLAGGPQKQTLKGLVVPNNMLGARNTNKTMSLPSKGLN